MIPPTDSAAAAADCFTPAEALAMTVASALATYAVLFLLAWLAVTAGPQPPAPNDRPPVRRAILRPPRGRSRRRSG